MTNRWGNNGNSERLRFLGLHNHCRWWLQPWNKRHLLLGREVMSHLDSILKSRDTTLPTKVHLVKALIFPVVMYGFESWTIKKAECWRTDAFELWCWRRLLRVPLIARRSNQSILKEISPEYSLDGLMLKLKLQYFGHMMWSTDSFEKTLMLGKIEVMRRRGKQRMTAAHWVANGQAWLKWNDTDSVRCLVASDSMQPCGLFPLSMGFSRQEYWSGVAIPFSRGCSPARNQTRASCISGRHFTVWATEEARSDLACMCESSRGLRHVKPVMNLKLCPSTTWFYYNKTL